MYAGVVAVPLIIGTALKLTCGCQVSVTLCHLRILMDQPTESISPYDASTRHDDS
jgi:hypothetical protein